MPVLTEISRFGENMAATGRPKTPTSLAVIKGQRTDRINFNEPIPKEAVIEPPEGAELGKYGRWEWDRMIDDLKAKGVATGWDVNAFVQWCQNLDAYYTAHEIIREEGMMITEPIFSRKGDHVGDRKKIHPAWQAYMAAGQQMLRLSARFGFTPSDRAALNIAPPKAEGTGEDLLTG